MRIIGPMRELLSFLDFDTKTQDGITNITVWLAILVYFLFVNFFVVPVNVPNQPADYMLYLFVLFVPAATKLIFFSGDPILHKGDGEASFFQSQFPDTYIAAKFNIERPLAQHLWFQALDGRKGDEEIKRTYQYGFTCRLVYYIRRLTLAFTFASVLWLTGETAYLYRHMYHRWVGYAGIGPSFVAINDLKGKLFYLLNVLGIALYLRFANKTGSRPTGVWARWKHINDRNKAWLDQFSTLENFRSFVASGEQSPKQSR